MVLNYSLKYIEKFLLNTYIRQYKKDNYIKQLIKFFLGSYLLNIYRRYLFKKHKFNNEISHIRNFLKKQTLN